MSGPVFVDSNVLVYVHDARDRAKQAMAAAWHERLWREGLGRVSVQVVTETYVNLRRMSAGRLSAEQAWQIVARYFPWNPLPADEMLLRRARQVEQRFGLSWWDSMIVAAAQLQDCETLLTEDLQDGADYGGVRARSPFAQAIEQPAATYSAAPNARTLHRTRGRPRKVSGAAA